MSRKGKRSKREIEGDFYSELERRLEENKKLYGGDSPFVVLDTPVIRFVASYLGTNPWKVLVPMAVVFSLVLRVVFGRGYSEFVLRILGGP